MTSFVKDKYNRPLSDIRISVTDQCNFRCTYCMPAEIFGPNFKFFNNEKLLTFEEITRITTSLAELGVEKVRLTGGEPLLRKDLHLLIKEISKIQGITDIALTTNGVHLPKHARLLRESGLARVNVSLDAIDDEIFRRMNGRSVGVKPVLKGIRAAIDAGLDVKVNMVVKKGENDSQIIPMASYFLEQGIQLRFIEFMDVGSTNGWNFNQVVTKKEIYKIVNSLYPLEAVESSYFGEVAKRYQYKRTNVEVGFISSVSESFCSSCTRARISADGKLYTCLFAGSGYDLRTLLRTESSTQDITDMLRNVWSNRDDRYSDERCEETQKRPKIEMSYIGG